MLLDVRFLIELLRSPWWTWTTAACDRLLMQLGLQEAASTPLIREFRAPSGLVASVRSGVDGNPVAIEFPSVVPDAMRNNPGLVGKFVELVAWPLKAVLGEPLTDSWSWSLPAASISVRAAGADTVALVVARP